MSEFQAEKELVLRYYEALDEADGPALAERIGPYVSEDLLWRGYHPFGEIRGVDKVASAFWTPLKAAFSHIQRRQDIFFAGRNQIDDFASVWVVSMGHLMGLFDAPWLGIQPTSKIAMLRYAEFNCVRAGRITQSAMFFDIPHLMVQAGLNPFPVQTAVNLVQPGPLNHGGLLFSPQPPEEGIATLATINRMISDLGTWNNPLSLEDELRRSWAEDMIWWGPTGIGATYTIERYAKQHAGPFRAAFSERTGTGHIARLAEGTFGGFFGWPNFTAVNSGPFLGQPPSHKRSEFRVIDIYRRRADKLAENWVFIDLPHFLMQQGIDLIGQTKGQPSA
jgi:hypothetical protein